MRLFTPADYELLATTDGQGKAKKTIRLVEIERQFQRVTTISLHPIDPKSNEPDWRRPRFIVFTGSMNETHAYHAAAKVLSDLGELGKTDWTVSMMQEMFYVTYYLTGLRDQPDG